jgi:2-polyprenyl-3-methyl-5-hydroxy-6-metoxy-1,4-benzoquinol methylase
MSDLYKHPDEYDREHLGDEEDFEFYLSLSRRLAPRKVLELGCGTGRITFPLAELGFEVVGLDNQTDMLRTADKRRMNASFEIRQRQIH